MLLCNASIQSFELCLANWSEVSSVSAGIFDPFGFSKGNVKELQTKEIKNGAHRFRSGDVVDLSLLSTCSGPLRKLCFPLLCGKAGY